MRAATVAVADCPCGRTDDRGRALTYARCCQPLHSGATPAPDAQRLMRSRYSAFVLGAVPYLLRTWHARTRPSGIELDTAAQWLGLEIRSARSTGPEAAEVEFVARCRVGGRAVRQHEISRFVREAGHWYYVDGDVR